MAKRISHTDSKVITGNEKAKDYLRMQKKLGRFYLKNFMNILLDFHKKDSLLEIGPGPGYQTCFISQKIPDATIKALEYSPDMVSIAKKYAQTQGVDHKIDFIHGSVEDENLLEELGKFDLIYSTFSLHHWTDPKKSIANLYKVLKDNGIMYIYDFKRGGLFYYLSIFKGIWESIRASYIPEEIENIMKDLNIKNYEIKSKYPYMWLIVKK